MPPARLRRRDRQRVEEALRNDADLARQIDLVREEFAETIHLNETLGAPSPRVAGPADGGDRRRDAAARKRVPGAVASWLTGFFANLSPRTHGGGGVLRRARDRVAGVHAGGHFHQAAK